MNFNLSNADEFGNSNHYGVLNAIQTRTLDCGARLEMQVQTGLCNVRTFLDTLPSGSLQRKAYKMKDFRKDKLYKKEKPLFEERHENEYISVWDDTTECVISVPIKLEDITGPIHNQTMWLHQELMHYYITWATGESVTDLIKEIFDTKLPYLRDLGMKRWNKLKYYMENYLVNDNEDGRMISVACANRLSKVVFSYNDEGVVQWNNANDSELMLRLEIMNQAITYIADGQFKSWTDLGNWLKAIGRHRWVNYDGGRKKAYLRTPNEHQDIALGAVMQKPPRVLRGRKLN